MKKAFWVVAVISGILACCQDAKAQVPAGKDSSFSTRSPVFKQLKEMRGVPTSMLDTGTIYFRNTSGLFMPYKWSATSTAADDSVTVIQRTGTAMGRFVLYYENYIKIEWFGAVPNDGGDDSYAVQKAINFAQRSATKTKIMAGSGTFIVNNVSVYKDINNDGAYEFNTLTLEGVLPAFGENQSATGANTVFQFRNAHGFCINFQYARNCAIRNISFVGTAPSPGTVKNTFEWTDAQWSSGVTDNQYSPNAAIVVDAFHASVPAGKRYAGLSAWYSNVVNSGSSMITIEGCAFRNTLVGIMISPNGRSQNCDNIRVSNCAFENCRSALASGQPQSRANTMDNCYILGGIKYVINCVDYGETRGTAPTTYNMNIAGGVKYLHYITGGFAGITHINLKAELLHAIGRSDVMPVNLFNCHITLAIPQDYGVLASPIIAEGGQVVIKGGTIDWFDNAYAGAFPFNVEDLSLDGVKMNGLVTNTEYYLQKTIYNNVDCQSAGSEGTIYSTNAVWGLDVSIMSRKPFMPGMSFSNNNIVYRATGPKIDWLYIEDRQVVVNTVSSTAYFLAAKPGAYRINDLLTTQIRIDNANDIFSPANTSIGWVYDIKGDTVKLKYPPYGINPATKYSIYITRVPKFINRTTGNVTNGSNVITGVVSFISTFKVGDYVKGSGIPRGARVTGVGTGALTLSLNATATAANVQLYDQEYKQEGSAAAPSDLDYLNSGWFAGDVIYKNPLSGNDDTYMWVCVSPGFLSSSPAPVFKTLAFGGSASKGAADAQLSSGTYTPKLSNATNVASSTAYAGQYTRIGDIVTFFCKLDIAARGAGATELGISLPVASTFTMNGEAAGTGSSSTGLVGSVKADVGNKRLAFNYVASGASVVTFWLSVTYKVAR